MIKSLALILNRIPLKRICLYILFIIDYISFKKLSKVGVRFDIHWKNRYPQLFDKTESTPFDTHYIYHPAWATRIVKLINPEFHIDLSSTLAFSSTLSAFIPVHFYDYRPAKLFLSGLESKKTNEVTIMATKMLAHFYDLLKSDDVEYIKKDGTWFNNLPNRPLHLKSDEVGVTGHLIDLHKKTQSNIIMRYMKSIFR